MEATFSVPARRSFSWLPPMSSGRKRMPTFHIKRADAFRSMKFVSGQREKANRGIREPDRDFADSLDGIGVKEHALSARDLGDFFHRKKHAGFVIGPHHGNDRRVRPDGVLQFIKIEIPIAVDAEKRHFAAALAEFLAMSPHGAVFDRSGDDVLPALDRVAARN